MTDTLTRLTGPVSPKHSEAGSTIYDPSTGIIALKNAVFTNHDPLAGGWAYLSIGDMAVHANRLVSGLYVPPHSTVIVPLDTVLDGSVDDIRARQIVDMSYSKLLITTAVAVINSTTDGTSFATASWASVADRVYAMTVVSTHASAAEVPSSITDTHTGVTWQLVQTVVNAAGTMRITQYRAQASGANSTTTTVNFSGTMTGCHIVIASIDGGDATGTDGDEAILAGGVFVGSTVTQTAITIPGVQMCGARLAAASSNAGGTSTPGSGFTELSDAAIATPTNMLTTEYSITPGAVADFTLATTSTDKILALLGLQDISEVIAVTLNGVVVT